MSKWDNFWSFVQSTAQKQNKKFFLDCGEGRSFETDEFEGEDVSGWLIPLEQVPVFEAEWRNKDKKPVDDRWNEFITFAIWSMERESLSVSFETF